MRVLGLWLPATVPAGVTLAKGDGDALQWISPGYLLLLWAVVTAGVAGCGEPRRSPGASEAVLRGGAMPAAELPRSHLRGDRVLTGLRPSPTSMPLVAGARGLRSSG